MLSPYRVIDLTDDRGHCAGLVLAQLGADVVAIEPPGGQRARHLAPFAGDVADPERSFHHWSYNRGKRSVVLDLAGSEADRDRLRELVKGADVLIDAEPAGRLAGLGLAYDDLAALNPALVHVSITAFGQSGPKAGYAHSEITMMAAGGYAGLTGDEDRPPLRLSLSQAYHHAAVDAAGAALIALLERHRSGLGQHVDISVQASMLQATQSSVLAEPLGAPNFQRIAGGVKMPPFDIRLVWPCADGYVTIAFLFGTSIGPFSARLMEWVHDDGYCDEWLRDRNWVDFAVLVDEGEEDIATFERAKKCLLEWLGTKTKAELLDQALTRRLLIAPVTTTREVVDSPQLAFRDYWETIDVPALDQAITFNGPMGKFGATPLAPLGPPPRLGEHTEEVLGDAARTAPIAERVRAEATGGGSSAPLAGLKVLDFMWAMAGPATTRVFADYGATVIRVESATKLEVARGLQPFFEGVAGAERSGLFLNMNTGKLGMTLDLTKPEAREVVHDLVRWADVVCESFSPRAMKAWGLDYETLKEVNPELIMMSSCLMGQTGPLAMFAGFGNLAAAISGFHNITGWPDRDPSGPFSAYTDYVAPRISVALVLAALDHRRRTGEGQYLDYSQAEGVLHLLAPALLDERLNGRTLERNGNRDVNHAPNGIYPSAGIDRWVAIACETDDQWRTLAGVLDRPDLAGLTSAERLERAAELDDVISAWTAPRDNQEVEDLLQQHGVPAHLVAVSQDSWADPQLAERGHFVITDHAELGPVTVEGTRFVMSRTPPEAYRAAPTLGQDTFEILTDLLGYDVDRVAEIAAAEALD
jgi:crotonobetainyl-CoA:carnitine CoA-transferase CaiB-like acyl-CoA transferase